MGFKSCYELRENQQNQKKAEKSVICGYGIVFNPDFTFTLYFSLGTISGSFIIDSNSSVILVSYGSITNISITSQGISFNLVLDSGCSADLIGEKDEIDKENPDPPTSFLEKVDGTYWKGTWEDYGTTFTI